MRRLLKDIAFGIVYTAAMIALMLVGAWWEDRRLNELLSD